LLDDPPSTEGSLEAPPADRDPEVQNPEEQDPEIQDPEIDDPDPGVDEFTFTDPNDPANPADDRTFTCIDSDRDAAPNEPEDNDGVLVCTSPAPPAY
jgi:hypothetical protein